MDVMCNNIATFERDVNASFSLVPDYLPRVSRFVSLEVMRTGQYTI